MIRHRCRCFVFIIKAFRNGFTAGYSLILFIVCASSGLVEIVTTEQSKPLSLLQRTGRKFSSWRDCICVLWGSTERERDGSSTGLWFCSSHLIVCLAVRISKNISWEEDILVYNLTFHIAVEVSALQIGPCFNSILFCKTKYFTQWVE